MEGESPKAWGFCGRESVALPLTHLLFGVTPHASVNVGENLVSVGSQPLAMVQTLSIQRDVGVLSS